MRVTLLVLLGTIAWAASALAQMRVPGPAPSVLFSTAQRGLLGSVPAQEVGDTLQRKIRPTYWGEGALIGGVLGGIGGAFLGHGLCQLSEEYEKDCTGALLLGTVFGAALLGVPGALIGGQFPKAEDQEGDQPE